MTRRLVAFVAVLSFGFLAIRGETHSVFAGDYDTSIAVSVKGDVTAFQAGNPRSFFDLVIKTNGGTETWRVETAAAGARIGEGSLTIIELLSAVAKSHATVTVWLYPPRTCATSAAAASDLKGCRLREAGGKEIEVGGGVLASSRDGGRFALSFADEH